MKFFVNSILEYIDAQVEHFTETGVGNRRLQFMIPTLSCGAAILLAKQLESICDDRKVKLEFKVAEALIETWTPQEAQELEEKNRAKGSLTSDRNEMGQTESVLQVLVGSKHVTDNGSLADFHQCDMEVLWAAHLKASFRDWSKRLLEQAGIGQDEVALEQLDIILGELRERFDLFQISLMLDELELDAQSGRDVVKQLLASLQRFELPNLSAFRFGQKRKTFRYYVTGAYDFFRYEMFIDSKRRIGSLRRVEAFMERYAGEVPPERIVPFNDESEFFGALKAHIASNSSYPSLMLCDFVYIYDEILGFTPPKEKKEPVKKLAGGPIEVILQALWVALGKFGVRQKVTKITITGKRFRHDYMTDEGIATTANTNEAASIALGRLLGGIDALCSEYIQLMPEENGPQVEIVSRLINDDLHFSHSKTAEPFFEFDVVLEGESGDPQKFVFAWKLPAIHPYRLADGLITLASSAYEQAMGIWMLPAFQLTYYQELMEAKNEDEICRVLMHCINECRPGSDTFMTNLFVDAWQRTNDPLAPYLQQICVSYRDFIREAHEKGIHAALHLGSSVPALQAYKNAAEAFVKKDPQVRNSLKLAGMLMRSFLVLGDKGDKNVTKWSVAKHEPSGIVTILHPALLEMLQAQVAFFFSAFSTVASNEFHVEKPFRVSKWQYYADMATIQMPLTGLLVDEDMKLDVNIVGKGLIHRLGKDSLKNAPMTTRFLVQYDSFDEDDVTDAEIFRITRESKLLFRFLKDYWYMHPQAYDGISIAVYRNDDIQPILSAIHEFLGHLEEMCVLDDERKSKYAVKVTLFSESSDETAIVHWLEQWQERWEAAESVNNLHRYTHCQFTVAHRIVSAENKYKQFKETLEQDVDCDIFVLYNFIEAGRSGNEFREADEFNETNDTLKFPILEKSLCANSQPDEELQRAQIISNRQFRINALHAEILVRLRKENILQGREHIVLGCGDFEPWKKVIDAAHAAAEWVICIDANIDEKLIAYSNVKGARKRELIGFGSGVGSHGESNYTISTQKFFIDDLKRILLESFKRIYMYGTSDDDVKITEKLMESAGALAGLSLIRALGPSDYVRDFMSYALMLKILPLSKDHICDQVFSIDAYRHWFDMTSDDDRSHPDLLWLRAILNDDRTLRIEAKLIECKMAMEDSDHVEKAKSQIENGLRVLMSAFAPKHSTVSDYRPDQRYWHLQLHRLIASRAKILPSQESAFLNAMEKLAEGDFEISWDAAIFTFWTDTDQEGLVRFDTHEIAIDDANFSIPIYSAGYKFLKDVCSGNIQPINEWNDNIRLIPKKSDATPLQERKVTLRLPTPQLNEEGDDTSHDEQNKNQPASPAPIGKVSPVTPAIVSPIDKPIPPSPKHVSKDTRQGDKPFVIEPDSDDKTTIPPRILLGRQTMGSRDIYWEFGHKGLNNRHLLIFGSSGMGKTYAIQAILCELGRHHQNSLIVDYTNGYLEDQIQNMTLNFLKPIQDFIKIEKLPITPFKKQSLQFGAGNIIHESDNDVSRRITSIFKTVYNLGSQQYSVLLDAIVEGVKCYKENLTFENVVQILEKFTNDNKHSKNTVQSTISKINPFISENFFTSDSNCISWIDLFSNIESKCRIFQLAMINSESQRILTEFILWDLYAYLRSTGNESKPKVVVLDEVQNLDHSLDAPVAKYLTEGRKFGISLIAATQTLSNLEKEEQARLFLTAHKLFFRPTDPEMGQYAEYARQAAATAGDKSEWMQKLAALQKGECLSIGPSLNETTGKLENRVAKIKITSLEDRGFNG